MNAVDSQAAAPLSREIALQAAEWFVLLHSGEASEADHRAFEAWRARADVHEQAWLRALAVSQRAGSLPPTLGAPALARKQRRLGAVGRRDTVRALALLITAAPVGWLAWRAAPWMQWTSTHATATGERREWTLADGSRVQLNMASAISVRMDGTARRIRQHAGEILVETAHAPPYASQPFMVQTDDGQMQALGTRFIVRKLEHGTALAVLEGAVRVTPAASAKAGGGHAGEQLHFDGHGASATRPVAARDSAWTLGVLYAENLRLQDFLAELSRYREGLVQCDDDVADLRVSGTYQLQDTDRILALLAQTLPVRVHERSRY